MTRIPMFLAIVLAATAFAGGYLLRQSFVARADGGAVLAQPTTSPSPASTPRGSRSPGTQRAQGDRGLVVGTVESVSGRTLVVKVSSSRGLRADQGAAMSVQVEEDASIWREIVLTDLKKGQTVTLRGSMVDGKLVVRQIVVDLR